MADQAEKEQIEEMRAWWDEYGNYVIAGVVIGVLLLFGWNYYRTSKANAEIEASQMYDQLASHVAAANMAEAETAMGALEASYPDTAYAAQGKLAMARLYMDNNRDADAADVLRELVNDNDSPLFASVARLRLAKILQYQEEYEEVLTLLEVEEKPGFTARYAEARGDALVELERFDEARDQYLLALTDSGQTVDTNFLQLKILDLPKPAAADVLPEATDGDIASDLPDTEAAASEAPDADGPDAGATDAEASEGGAGADVEADAVDGNNTAADDTATDETNE